MRIRKRPNPSSSSSPSAPSLPVPPPALFPDPPRGGREGAAGKDSNGVDHARVAPRLHSDGDLKIHCTPAARPRSEPRLGVDGSSGGKAGVSAQSDRTGRGLAQVSRKNAAIAKEEEEEEEDGADKGWDAEVNSNSSSSSAPLLSEKKRGGKPVEKKKQGRKVGSSAEMMISDSSANNGSFGSRGVSDDNDRCEGKAEERAVGAAVHGKKRRSPAVLMEGSRCSRVNGRGWRCCQQTLVGYSLCEHHLGKGRLRSVTSVRGQLGTSKPRWIIDESNGVVPSTSPEKKKPPPPPVCAAGIKGANQLLAEEEDEEEQEEEEMARKTTTRKKKVGAVKARSISSLLDEFEVSSAAAAPPREQLMN